MLPPTIEQPLIDISVNPNDYQSRNRSFLQKQVDKRKKMLDSVVEYVHITMTPYMMPTEIEKLCNEILSWSESNTYKPQSVEVRERLSTYDLSHFIWNIAERLSNGRKYTGDDKAKFVKSLFPTICSEVEISSLSRNLKTKPRDGNIHIDEMEKDSIDFHYAPTQEKQTSIIGYQPRFQHHGIEAFFIFIICGNRLLYAKLSYLLKKQ